MEPHKTIWTGGFVVGITEVSQCCAGKGFPSSYPIGDNCSKGDCRQKEYLAKMFRRTGLSVEGILQSFCRRKG